MSEGEFPLMSLTEEHIESYRTYGRGQGFFGIILYIVGTPEFVQVNNDWLGVDQNPFWIWSFVFGAFVHSYLWATSIPIFFATAGSGSGLILNQVTGKSYPRNASLVGLFGLNAFFSLAFNAEIELSIQFKYIWRTVLRIFEAGALVAQVLIYIRHYDGYKFVQDWAAQNCEPLQFG